MNEKDKFTKKTALIMIAVMLGALLCYLLFNGVFGSLPHMLCPANTCR